LFIIFNILQRREVLLRSSIKVSKQSFHAVAEQFALLTPDVLSSVCRRLAEDGSISDSSPLSEDERRAFRLMKEVNLVNTAVPGSAASKTNMRNQIRAMMVEHGVPNFYVTINPADTHNPVVNFLAGDAINVDDVCPALQRNAWDQAVLVANNPFVGAKFFDVYMNAFIR
ncbi:hypothetical protein BC629DRAFT_1265173, partial [Irpex lacteus]